MKDLSQPNKNPNNSSTFVIPKVRSEFMRKDIHNLDKFKNHIKERTAKV